jgi:hypothetical protein
MIAMFLEADAMTLSRILELAVIVVVLALAVLYFRKRS